MPIQLPPRPNFPQGSGSGRPRPSLPPGITIDPVRAQQFEQPMTDLSNRLREQANQAYWAKVNADLKAKQMKPNYVTVSGKSKSRKSVPGFSGKTSTPMGADSFTYATLKNPLRIPGRPLWARQLVPSYHSPDGTPGTPVQAPQFSPDLFQDHPRSDFGGVGLPVLLAGLR